MGKTASTLTLNLSPVEMQALDNLCAEHDMSKTAVLRQALRMYQYMHERMKAGETIHLSGDQQRALDFIGPGFGQDLRNPPPQTTEAVPSTLPVNPTQEGKDNG